MRFCFCAHIRELLSVNVSLSPSPSLSVSLSPLFVPFPFLHLYILTLMGDFMISATSSCCPLLTGLSVTRAFENRERVPGGRTRLGTHRASERTKPHRTPGVDAICSCKIRLGPISEPAAGISSISLVLGSMPHAPMLPERQQYRDYVLIMLFSTILSLFWLTWHAI